MLKKFPVILVFMLLFCLPVSFAQAPDELEFNLDLNSPVVNLPKIFRTSIDLSGRGTQGDKTLPQTVASAEAINTWQSDLGLRNFYRIQYNLWEIQQLSNDQDAYLKLLSNYEEIIKKISDSGGTVILSLFGTPNGWGTVLDKSSAPHNLKAYKELVKNTIRRLSCDKKYNVWYEVWNAPDIDDFFIGGRAEYFNLYRAVGEAVKELRQETKLEIPLGGPSVSAWFRNIEPNDILTPEQSLIYELIKYCYSYRLPLDFISWHAYSSDPAEEKQDTIYNKPFVELIRDWLTYFKFNRNMPLVVDEWNFDGPANILPARGKNSNVGASYIPARLENMYEAGISYQTFFCLEDFGDSEAGAIRNLGVFSFDLLRPEKKGYPKAGYNAWRMLNLLGQDLFKTKFNDDFVGVIATRSPDYLALLVYNYIDPRAAMNYISHSIVYLNSAEQKAIIGIIKSDRMKKILDGQINVATLRLSAKTKGILTHAIELNNQAFKFSTASRKLKISLKGGKDVYLASRYIVDGACSRSCPFETSAEKETDLSQGYSETLELSPYSIQLLVFRKKPAVPAAPVPEKAEEVKPEENKPQAQTQEIKPEAKPETKPVVPAIEQKPENTKPAETAENKTPEIKTKPDNRPAAQQAEEKTQAAQDKADAAAAEKPAKEKNAENQ